MPRPTRMASRPRVRFLVNVLQAGDAHVRVNLRGREVDVPQQLLDQAQIGAGVEQVRRVGVPQLVGRHVHGQTRQSEILLQTQLHLPHRQPLVPGVDDDGRPRRGRCQAARPCR